MIPDNDPWRIALPTAQFAFYTLSPVLYLFGLATAPTTYISTKWKQAISLPLLISSIVCPYIYKDIGNGSFCAFCQIFPFAMFLRFSDVFWITPLLYGKEAYIEPSIFNKECWSFVRSDDGSKKENNNQKDKRFYHLFGPILANAIVFDILAAWIKTFTWDDLIEIQNGNYFIHQAFCFACVISLTSVINMMGQMMQLFHCLLVDKGYYSSADWRNAMDYPLLSTSLEDVWSRRWHRTMRPAWVASAYKPVYYVVRKYNANPKDRRLAVGLASFAVFMASGLTHEYSVLCNIGWNAYKKHFMGQQMVFFGIHGLFVVLEKTLFFVIKPLLPISFTTSRSFELIRRLYVIGFFTITFPIFINPYAHWGFHHLDALTPVESATRQFLLSKPFLRQISGSAL